MTKVSCSTPTAAMKYCLTTSREDANVNETVVINNYIEHTFICPVFSIHNGTISI